MERVSQLRTVLSIPHVRYRRSWSRKKHIHACHDDGFKQIKFAISGVREADDYFYISTLDALTDPGLRETGKLRKEEGEQLDKKKKKKKEEYQTQLTHF